MHLLSRRRLIELALVLGILGITVGVANSVSPYSPPQYGLAFQSEDPQSFTLYRAQVQRIDDGIVSAKLLDGARAGTVVTTPIPDTASGIEVRTNTTVLLTETTQPAFVFYDTYRIPGLLILSVVFILTVLLTSKRRGLMSLAGLTASLLIIFGVTIPLLIAGWNSLLVTVGSAFLIATVSMLVAHGFRRRTYVSLVCILIILLAVTIVAYVVVQLLGLTGIVDEAGQSLQYSHAAIDLSGVLVGGIVIAALGALDDVVTTQVAAVAEIQATDTALSSRAIYMKAIAVGDEHIAALVNTLALVYVGAGLPTLVVLSIYSENGLTIFNSSFIATELVRTLIVSIGLVAAVPLSTYLASLLVTKRRK